MGAEYSHILQYLKFFVKSDTRPRPAPDAEPPRYAPRPPCPASGGSKSAGKDAMMSTDSTET